MRELLLKKATFVGIRRSVNLKSLEIIGDKTVVLLCEVNVREKTRWVLIEYPWSKRPKYSDAFDIDAFSIISPSEIEEYNRSSFLDKPEKKETSISLTFWESKRLIDQIFTDLLMRELDNERIDEKITEVSKIDILKELKKSETVNSLKTIFISFDKIPKTVFPVYERFR